MPPWRVRVKNSISMDRRRNGGFVDCCVAQLPSHVQSVSQGRICSDNFSCCRSKIEAADQICRLAQWKYTDTVPTCLGADPKTADAWQLATRNRISCLRDSMGESRVWFPFFPHSRRTSHKASEAVGQNGILSSVLWLLNWKTRKRKQEEKTILKKKSEKTSTARWKETGASCLYISRVCHCAWNRTNNTLSDARKLTTSCFSDNSTT